MSKAEARRITVIEELTAGRISNAQAAQLLSLSVRQIMRLKREAAANGTMAVLHKSRGRKPVNALEPNLVAKVIEICTSCLKGYNFCHAADVLVEEYGIFLSVSTLARHLKAEGIRSPRAKRRPKRHRCREARLREGELAQMDASRFDWLSDGSYLHLHGAVDDATGRILALHFDKEETFEGYCQLMIYMNSHSCLPREVYTDARSVFVCSNGRKHELSLAEELAGMKERPSQFARALREVGTLLLIAGSPQAKGGIERLWGTLQDRLPKDMLRHGISTIEQANAFLRQYIGYYNRKFAAPATQPEKAYLPWQDEDEFALAFSKHETRVLDNGLVFSFQGAKYRLPLLRDGVRIDASPHDTVTVATSSRIGMKVIYKGQVLVPEKSVSRPAATEHKAIKPQTARTTKAKLISPWHKYSHIFSSEERRRVIFAEELSR